MKRIIDRDGDALHAFGQRGSIQHGAQQVRVAIELKREVHLAPGQAVKTREKVLCVLHAYTWLAGGVQRDKSTTALVTIVGF